MMKRLCSLLLVLLLCAALAVPVFALDQPRFYDEAALLSEADAKALNDKLDALSQQQNFDYAIVTMPALQGNPVDDVAKWYYDNYGIGAGVNHDGVLLLISMEDRDWCICCGGSGNHIINADAKEHISDAMLPDLSAGNYARAFNTFTDESNAIYEMAKAGETYKAPFPFFSRLLLSLVISLIVALIAVSAMKSNLRSVVKQTAAASYVVPGSLHIEQSTERYLYSNVTRTPRAQNNQNDMRTDAGEHTTASGKF